MVTRMTAYSAAVRATRLLTNAAWFGGSLMEVVALNPAAQEGGTVGEALAGSRDPRTKREAAPAAATGLLVLDAYLGEQQRGPAGLRDRASNRPGL
jgi:hypothetical protein